MNSPKGVETPRIWGTHRAQLHIRFLAQEVEKPFAKRKKKEGELSDWCVVKAASQRGSYTPDGWNQKQTRNLLSAFTQSKSDASYEE